MKKRIIALITVHSTSSEQGSFVTMLIMTIGTLFLRTNRTIAGQFKT